MGLEALVKFCLHLCGAAILINQCEYGVHAIVWLALELLYLTLTLHDQAYGNTLHATGREGRLHLSPEHWRELETHDAVEHTACLLGIHQVHVQMAWVLDSVQDGRFGNFVEDDTACLLLIQSENFAKVPADGFSLAVLIGCQPNLLGLLCGCFQFCDEFFLFLWNLIARFHGLLVYTEFFLFQVTDVSVGRHHFEVFTQELFYFLSLCRALDDN